MQSPYFNDVRKFSKVRQTKKQVDLAVERKDEISLREIRHEFLGLINQYKLERSSQCSLSNKSMQ